MGEVFLIVALVGLFIFFIYLANQMFIKKSAKKDEKKSDAGDKKKDTVKDDIPDILKEVTTGNYMYDLSKNTNEEVQFVEDSTLTLDGKDTVKRTNVEKAFDYIDDLGQDLDDDINIEIEEIDDVEDDFNDDIEELYSDSALLGDIVEDDSNATKNDVANEYKKLSKNMKALIIANALEKKNKD